MRVLHIGKYFPPFAGGIENFLGDLFPALETLGVETGALVHDHAFKDITPAGLQEVDFKDPGHPPLQKNIWRVPCYGELLYAPLSPCFPVWLHRVLKEFRPDVLHLHLPNVSAFWTILVPSARRIPWVIHWHSDVVASKIDRRLTLAYQLYKPFEQKILSLSRTVIATSPPYLTSSIALAPWKEKCKVVPLGLDPKRFPSSEKKMADWANGMWGSAELKILAVGRLTYYKGHEVLINAVSCLDNIKVIIVGDGERRKSLEELIVSSGTQDKIMLAGGLSQDKLNALLATCGCFCLPSVERTEAFGLVLLEAMRYGKPIVASNITGSGVGWVVNHDKTGLLVRPGDPGDLTAALKKMITVPEIREKMGRAGMERFNKHFHIQNIAPEIKEIYNSCLKKNTSGGNM